MTPTTSLLRLIRYAKPYRARIYRATVFSVLNKLFDIAPEALIGIAVDTVVNKQNSFLASMGFANVMSQLVLLAGLTLFIWIFESVFEYLYSISWRGIAQSIQHELRLSGYNHVQKLDMAHFEKNSSGQLMSILNDDINQLERFLDGGANSLIQLAVTVVVIGGIFVYFSPLIAVFAILPTPFIIYGTFKFQEKLAPLYANVRGRVADINVRLANNLSGMSTIKSYTAENFETENIRAESLRYLEANTKTIKVSSAVIPIIRMGILAGFLCTMVLGGYFTLNGTLQVGAYSILIYLTQRLLWPFTGLAMVVDQYQRAMASVQNILNLIETPIKIESGIIELSSLPAQGAIEFKNVNFAYEGRTANLVQVSLAIFGGQHIAFVGATGSGKSTLVKLLMRFYQQQSGEIFWNGLEIEKYTLESVRRNIGFVSQDVFLINGTIAENILYGKLDANLDEVKIAAQAAEAHAFIMQLPQQYQTQVGERGIQLSGGQRQRISLARAVLKNPPVLILDEATSAVDNETEAAILRSIDKILQGRTTISIAHRLSTIRKANVIHVLDSGSIVESGTHSELLNRGGQYAALWQLQAEEIHK